jgi:hypothetical protein
MKTNIDDLFSWYKKNGTPERREVFNALFDEYLLRVVTQNDDYNWLMSWIQGVLFDETYKSKTLVLLCGNGDEGKSALVDRIFRGLNMGYYGDEDIYNHFHREIVGKKICIYDSNLSYINNILQDIQVFSRACQADVLMPTKGVQVHNTANCIGLFNISDTKMLEAMDGIKVFKLDRVSDIDRLFSIFDYNWRYFVLYFWDRMAEV